ESTLLDTPPEIASLALAMTEDDEIASRALAMTGERVGPWRFIRLIGRGGMGQVYLAERADGAFTQEVAIKVLRRGLDTDDLLQRFRSERQILAGLQHP